MRDMFKKINAREKLIGWYHSGPKLRASDLEINELFKKYTPNPLLVIVDVQPKEVGVPTDAYFAVDEIKDVSCPMTLPSLVSSGNTFLTAVFLGRYYDFANVCPYSICNRGRGSGRNRCGTSSSRHQRRGRRNPFYSDNLTTSVVAGIAFATP